MTAGLIYYAKYYFWLRQPVQKTKDGRIVTLLDSLRQVEKQHGKPPADLANAPSLPTECADVWGCFCKMANCSYTEIKAYCELTGVQLNRFEVDWLIMLDQIRQRPPEGKPDD